MSLLVSVAWSVNTQMAGDRMEERVLDCERMSTQLVVAVVKCVEEQEEEEVEKDEDDCSQLSREVAFVSLLLAHLVVVWMSWNLQTMCVSQVVSLLWSSAS